MTAVKRITVLFLCAACFLLTSCGLMEEVPVFESKPAHNSIGPKALTKKEKELIGLLSGTDQEIYLFSYKADKEYRRIDFWVEIYKDGVLIDPHAGGFGMVPEETEAEHTGTLAIFISHTPDYRWRFSLEGMSSASEPNANYISGGRGFAQMFQPVEIEPDKEIVLYQSVFSDGPIAVFDEQEFVEHPERLSPYPYAHLIKCKFSKSAEEP
ncbi:MAG TPA: hypothetical protein VN366_13230 [Feifaniaceae bacterium]|nr:hypothetical protein [Feifaniaceae bacterium]